jgi:hypothetical protein
VTRIHSTAAEEFAVAFVGRQLGVAPQESKHLGAPREPDGTLARDGNVFAIIEVKTVMEAFPDPLSAKGSGWPQIQEVLDAKSPIELDDDLGAWFLYVSPDVGRIDRLLQDVAARKAIRDQVKALQLDPFTPIPNDFLAEYGYQDGPFKWDSEEGNQCQVIVRQQQPHGFINSSSDVVSLFLQKKVEELSRSDGNRESYFVKWANRANEYCVDQVHVVLVYEGQTEWTKMGMLFNLFADPDFLPRGTIDVKNLPDKQWNFWIVVRNPRTNQFLRGFSYWNGKWESLSQEAESRDS